MHNKGKNVMNSKNKRRKTMKTMKKSKLLPRASEVISSHIENGYNVSKTAKQFGVGWNTMHRLLDTPEAKAEIKRFNAELLLLSQRTRRLMITEGLKQFMRAKKKMTQKECGYFLANLTGSTSDVRIAKIQAGAGNIEGGSDNKQELKELEDFRKSLKPN